jgi:hypothetical protein
VAGDLIPPPSPARRTDPQAEPRATAQLEEAVQLVADAATVTPDPGPSPFRNRFGFVFGALAGIGACAAAAFALLFASNGGGTDGPELAANWSAWQPGTTQMLDGATEIAAHVGQQYKLDDGGKLVEVSASDLGEANLDIAVQPLRSDLQFLEGEGLMYLLSGNAANGMLAGKPSIERGRLLFREALELALYSFRYLDDVSMVAVLIPPSAEQEAGSDGGAAPQRAVFYRPGDLLEQLQVPLGATLEAETPTPETMSEGEAGRVDSLTLRNLFNATVQQPGSEERYLLLEEPAEVR